MGGSPCAEELETRVKALKRQADHVKALIPAALADQLSIADVNAYCAVADAAVTSNSAALATLYATVPLTYPPA